MVQVEHAVDGPAQLAGGGAGVEQRQVGGVGGRAQEGLDERPARRVVGRRVDPLLGRATVPRGSVTITEPGQGADDAAAVVDAVAQVPQGRLDGAVDEHAGAVDAGQPTADRDPEVAQRGQAAARAVEGVGSEVEVVAVAMTAAGPPAEVLARLQHQHLVALADEVGGGRQPGQPAADDDGSWIAHAMETIDRARL